MSKVGVFYDSGDFVPTWATCWTEIWQD